jgi:intraflagellar transport protein 122
LLPCLFVRFSYSDAAYYYWLLATETLKFVTAASPAQVTAADRRYLEKFHNYELKAELYYAYNIIYRYTEEPFVTSTPETIFNTSQFILNVIGGGGSAASNGGGGGAGGASGASGAGGAGANAGGEEAPMGVSRVYTLVALAKQAKTLGAFKLARKIYERLATLRVPPAWREQVCHAIAFSGSLHFALVFSPTLHHDHCLHLDHPFALTLIQPSRFIHPSTQIDLGALTVRSKRFADRDELLPMCSRCSTPNPLLSAHAADACVHCRAPFLRSLHTVCDAGWRTLATLVSLIVPFVILPFRLLKFRPARFLLFPVRHAAARRIQCGRRSVRHRGALAD